MGVYKIRKNEGARRTSWTVRWRMPDDEQPKQRTFVTKRDAEDYQAELKLELAKAELHARESPIARRRLGELVTVAQWVRRTERARHTGVSAERDEALIRSHIEPSRQGEMLLSDVRRRDVEAWVQALRLGELTRKPLAWGTIRKSMQILSRGFASAVDDGMLPANPAANVSLGKAEAKHLFLAAAQVDELVEATNPHYRTFVRFLAESGLRISEAAALQVRHISSRDDTCTIAVIQTLGRSGGKLVVRKPKTAAARRSVIIAGRIAEEILALTDARTPDE